MAKIETTFDEDTVWLSIDQMAELFQRDRSVIGKHYPNAELPLKDYNNFRFLSYDEINHKDIMSFYVRECVEDKMIIVRNT